MKRIIAVFSVFMCVSAAVLAQPRQAEKSSRPAGQVKAAPSSLTAKYEGGLFGFTKKETGILKFDDGNERIVFFGKDGKEMFGIPYKSILIVSPQSKSVTSTAGHVVRQIPLPGSFLGSFMKEKRRYLLVQFDDPDVDAKGIVNFKVANKELLDSVIETLGKKANLTQRGDAYYRPRPPKTEI